MTKWIYQFYEQKYELLFYCSFRITIEICFIFMQLIDLASAVKSPDYLPHVIQCVKSVLYKTYNIMSTCPARQRTGERYFRQLRK